MTQQFFRSRQTLQDLAAARQLKTVAPEKIAFCFERRAIGQEDMLRLADFALAKRFHRSIEPTDWCTDDRFGIALFCFEFVSSFLLKMDPLESTCSHIFIVNQAVCVIHLPLKGIHGNSYGERLPPHEIPIFSGLVEATDVPLRVLQYAASSAIKAYLRCDTRNPA